MKQLLFGVALSAVASSIWAQDAPNFTIEGTIKDANPPEVYLNYANNKGLLTDSARVIDHHYTLTGNIPTGEVVTLTTAGPDAMPSMDNIASIYLSPAAHFSITHTTTFANLEITGSPANDEYHKLLDREKTWEQEEQAIATRLGKATTAGQADEAQEIGAELDLKRVNKNEEVYGDYIRVNPSSPLVVYAFAEYVGDLRGLTAADVPKMQSVFDMLPASYRESASGKSFQNQLNNLVTFDEKAGVGKPAPDFTQNDPNGHAVTLSSYRGKFVLLDFWASWCGPCREENPTVVAAYQHYHDKGFEILSVSLDKSGDAWKKAIRDDKLTWTHVSDLQYWDNAAARLYGVQGVPQNFLIDPNGNIIARGLRGPQLEEKLQEVLK